MLVTIMYNYGRQALLFPPLYGGKSDSIYSETCSCDHLYSETTSIQRRRPTTWSCPNCVALPCIFTSIKRPPLFKDHFFWPKRGRLIQVSLY